MLLLTSSAASSVANAVSTANIDFSAILGEVISLLPVVLPVVVGFIGVRKGISFLIGSLRRA